MDLHDHERVAVALQNLRDADEELNNLIAAEAGLRAAATELLARAGELSRRIREAEPGVDQWKELKRSTLASTRCIWLCRSGCRTRAAASRCSATS